jgi:D-hexose-6-phosphate mutarotase
MADDQILEITDPIMDNLMDASTTIDHDRHVQDFTDRLKRIVTPDHLRRVCEQYQREKGYFSRREPAAVIWKPWFTEAQGAFGRHV